MFDMKLLSQLAQASIDLDNQIMETKKKIARSAMEAEGDMAEASSAMAKRMIKQFNDKSSEMQSRITQMMTTRDLLKKAGKDLGKIDKAIDAALTELESLVLSS